MPRFPWNPICKPYQVRALEEFFDLVDKHERKICMTGPTGSGKTVVFTEAIRAVVSTGLKAIVYTNRRLLTSQISGVLNKYGIQHGIMAAGHAPNSAAPVQICSFQTQIARVKSGYWSGPPKADLIIVDEAHNCGGGETIKILEEHLANDSTLLLTTATPIEVPLATKLIVLAKNSELRQEGMHVRCEVYSPTEPEMVHIRRQPGGEIPEALDRKLIPVQHVFGSMIEHYKILNPNQLPAVCFGPGRSESLWIAQQFMKEGIAAAHLDCDDIWRGKFDADGNPVLIPSSQDNRDDLFADLKSGKVKIICNRFVLREGWDFPELYHVILATVFGSVTSYLQAVGRLLRSSPGQDHVVLQDHGANFWRHGSPNADREWDLTQTANMISSMREQAIREKKEPDPITCPQCFQVRLAGAKCMKCGFVCSNRSRVVVQVNGKLKKMSGDRLPPRKTKEAPDTEKLWIAEVFRAKNSDRTFRQARGNFYRLHGYWPPPDLPMMPREDVDWYRKVKSVDRKDLK